MSLADPKALFECKARRYVEAEIPNLGKVRFRSFTAGERNQLEAEIRKDKNPETAPLRPIIATVCDGAGDLVYTPDDLEKLVGVDALVIDAMTDVINHNFVNQRPAAEMIEAAKKN